MGTTIVITPTTFIVTYIETFFSCTDLYTVLSTLQNEQRNYVFWTELGKINLSQKLRAHQENLELDCN